MLSKDKTCCSSPAAAAYWFTVSLVAWGILSLVGLYWHRLRGLAAETILLAASVGCFANWVKNRTYHCGITGPLFLAIAVLLLLSNAGVIHMYLDRLLWPTVLMGTGVALLLEWRYSAHRG